MAININANFHCQSATPLDDRTLLTKAEMLTVDENIYPSPTLVLCSDDNGIYIYNASNTPSAETGKFVLFEGGGGDIQSISQNGTALTPDAEGNVDIPSRIATVAPVSPVAGDIWLA